MIDKEIMTSENAKEGKKCEDTWEWKHLNKTSDYSYNANWRHKWKDNGERRETWKIPRHGQVKQAKQDLPKEHSTHK